MNRTEEYFQRVCVKPQQSLPERKTCFYDTICTKVEVLEEKSGGCLQYREILMLEEKLSFLFMEAQQTLDSVVVNSSNDLVLYFEGIKRIIKMKFQTTERKLKKIKESKLGVCIDLEPEQPPACVRVDEVLAMEEENKKLVEKYNVEGYKQTRRRLLEVETIQDTIFQHLTLQDERIDDIIDLTSRAEKYITGSNDVLGNAGNSSKFFRRVLFILLICLSFILLFLNFYYK